FKEVNIFTDIGMINTTNQKMQNDNNALWSRIVNNRRVIYSIEYLKHYFDHFKPGFLFIRGDGNPKFSTQDVGQLYLWELPFFIAGSLFLFRQRIGFWWILPLWMIIGIIPAATARETPHALRIETTLPTFQIITAIGITVFLSKILNFKYFKFLIVIFIFSLLFFNFSYYVHGYYTHYPREYSGEWQYGYEESIDFVKKIRNNYDEIHITTELGRPYMYYLFYLKYDPRQYRKIAVIDRDVFGFVHVNSFDKYFFFKDLVKVENKNKKILYIDVASKIRDNIKVVKEFRLLNKSKVLVAYEM
ncbi:MAG: hypothetical protein Q7K55_04635, partial [Candidatus Levybacteria bacterium]|nr:hypothetical protein [Candidatus Levybacteria bacterium]